MQLNLWHGGELMDNVLGFIRKEDPDVLTCQEVNNSKVTGVSRSLTTLKTFSEVFDYKHIFFPQVLWSKDPRIEQGLAIFSRFPIKRSNIIFFDKKYSYYPMTRYRTDWSDYPAAIGHGVIEAPVGRIDVYNVHGIWGFDGRDSQRRIRMSDAIIQQVRDKEKVILAGDFNMFPSTNSIANLGKRLHNIFGDELKTTHNLSRKPPGYGKEPVDMMFVSPDIKVIDHYCPQVDVSDHLPLVAVLEVLN